MSYYKNFGWVLRNPIFRTYSRWAYRKGAEDLKKLDRVPYFEREVFSCLLCGVGNESTPFEFISFVRQRNVAAVIWIIDLGEEQIRGVRRMVSEKFSNDQFIKTLKINTLELLSVIQKVSIDWIETDGFLPYFDSDSLQKLIQVWSGLLRTDGFVTTRMFSTYGFLGGLAERFMVWTGKVWLSVTVYGYSREELSKVFNDSGFKFVEGVTPLPTFKRFILVKS